MIAPSLKLALCLSLLAVLPTVSSCAPRGGVPAANPTAIMPTSKANAIDYIEIPSHDPVLSKTFFVALFGWKFTDYGPDYTSFDDGRLSGGFFRSPIVSATASGGTLVVFYSPDLAGIRDRALKLGATVTRDIYDFPGGRRFHFTEPGGSELAIWSEK
ncbi:MAG: VOC family protein [Candidatus Didemnitutus sp.]|nr:VOC family protein [Candidatus Didemnitutus sp.]